MTDGCIEHLGTNAPNHGFGVQSKSATEVILQAPAFVRGLDGDADYAKSIAASTEWSIAITDARSSIGHAAGQQNFYET